MTTVPDISCIGISVVYAVGSRVLNCLCAVGFILFIYVVWICNVYTLSGVVLFVYAVGCCSVCIRYRVLYCLYSYTLSGVVLVVYAVVCFTVCIVKRCRVLYCL